MNKKMKSAPFYEIFFLTMIAITANLNTQLGSFLSYYLNGIVGFGVVLAGSFVTIFRIWDAVTNLGMGTVADRTKTKFDRFTPYMLTGAIGAMIIGQLMINLPPVLPEGNIRKAGFIVLYMLFIVFTTMEVSGLRSTSQVCIRDQKQRATFGMVNGIYVTIYYFVANMYIYSRLMPRTKGFHLPFFQTLITVFTIVGLIATLLYLAFYYKYDKNAVMEEQGKKQEKVTLKDALHLFRTNRPFLMLILSAGSDKLATTLQGNATVVVIMFAIAVGNAKLNSAINGYTMIPSIIMILLGLGAIGRKYGTKKAMVISSWGGIVTCVLGILLWVFGNYKTLNFPSYEGFSGWNFFTLAFLILTVIIPLFQMSSSNFQYHICLLCYLAGVRHYYNAFSKCMCAFFQNRCDFPGGIFVEVPGRFVRKNNRSVRR